MQYFIDFLLLLAAVIGGLAVALFVGIPLGVIMSKYYKVIDKWLNDE